MWLELRANETNWKTVKTMKKNRSTFKSILHASKEQPYLQLNKLNPSRSEGCHFFMADFLVLLKEISKKEFISEKSFTFAMY